MSAVNSLDKDSRIEAAGVLHFEAYKELWPVHGYPLLTVSARERPGRVVPGVGALGMRQAHAFGDSTTALHRSNQGMVAMAFERTLACTPTTTSTPLLGGSSNSPMRAQGCGDQASTTPVH
ncbi:hypothetical protein NDU88_002829 [Pleurodeles waltl]|uniref:Uncharacterized protein n=1 Tax=Pleurodeles waltl TaxID=8319 RepID=A0AAV7QAZ9_PLEWA|nr:hypothetical protein NDU88_002829 [Pleurodeles waltl]